VWHCGSSPLLVDPPAVSNFACHTRHQGSFSVILRPLPRSRHTGTDDKDHFDPSEATKALTKLSSTTAWPSLALPTLIYD
jgi:hypothetical protein